MELPLHQTAAGRIEWSQRKAATSSARHDRELEDDADRNGNGATGVAVTATQHFVARFGGCGIFKYLEN
jgi:hypothetical protein